MSFTDPLAINVGTGSVSLPRTGVGDHSAEYTSADGLVVVSASHDLGKRFRRVLRVDVSKLSSDPFKPDEIVKRSMSHYVVFDLPTDGFTSVEVLAAYSGFKAMYSASSDALISKLLGGES